MHVAVEALLNAVGPAVRKLMLRGVDLCIVLGWPLATGLVHRCLARTRTFVTASPAYWAAHGMPRHPRELQRHNAVTLWRELGPPPRAAAAAPPGLAPLDPERDLTVRLYRVHCPSGTAPM